MSETNAQLYAAVGTAVAALNTAMAAAAAAGIWLDMVANFPRPPTAPGQAVTAPVITLNGGNQITVYGSG